MQVRSILGLGLLLFGALLFQQGCGRQEGSAGFSSTNAQSKGLRGPVASAITREYGRFATESGILWQEFSKQEYTFDAKGDLVEEKTWNVGKPISHLIHETNDSGYLVHADIRVQRGQPGGERRFFTDGLRCFSQTFDARNQMIEQQERVFDAGGRNIKRSQVLYRREEGEDRVITKMEWKVDYLGADSVSTTYYNDGLVREKSLMVAGILTERSDLDDAGKVVRRGRMIPTGSPSETMFVWQDGNGRMLEQLLESTLEDGGSSNETRVLQPDGSLASLHVEVYSSEGLLMEERHWMYDAAGAMVPNPVLRYLYLDDAAGNWVLKVQLVEGKMQSVWARDLRYHPA